MFNVPVSTIGIEIEFDDDTEDHYIMAKIESHRDIEKISSRWTFVHDGSCGAEAVSRPMKPDRVYEEVCKLIEFLDKIPVEINRDCGIHVHVGAQFLAPDNVLNLLVGWMDFEDLIFRYFKPYSHRRDRYCKPLVDSKIHSRLKEWMNHVFEEGEQLLPNTAKDLAYILTGSPYPLNELRTHKYRSWRYYALNLASLWLHKTLEIRLFNPTLDPERITGYALFAHDFVQQVGYRYSLQPFPATRMENFLRTEWDNTYYDVIPLMNLLLEQFPHAENIRKGLKLKNAEEYLQERSAGLSSAATESNLVW